ncbi:MAG: AI-2E family transporter [Anaerolineae bacterium]|nr:AI-2E family transporter [Anaerolineae bacterium]
MSRIIVRIVLAIMTTLLVLVVFWQFRIAIIYVFISLTLAAVVRPLSTRLIGKRLIKRILWTLAYIVAFLAFFFLIFLSIRFALAELQTLTEELSVRDVWVFPDWLVGTTFQSTILNWLPPPSDLFHAFTGDKGQLILPTLFSIVKNIGSIIAAVVVILILSIYWSINQIHFERLWLSLLPIDQRKQARGIWRNVEPEVGAYVRNQVMLSVVAGVLLGVGYWLLGSQYPIFMALAGAAACMIPVVGLPLALIPPLLVGLITSTQLSLFTTLYAFIIMVLLVVFIKPRFFRLRWNNPLPTLVLLLVLADAFGVIGIIVAPPISAVCQILWSRLVSRHLPSGAAANITDLKARELQLREKISTLTGETPPLITSSLEKLSDLITNAEPLLQGVNIEEVDTITE